MSGGPTVAIHVQEYGREGRAVLRFTARPAPGGSPVRSVEYRVGHGPWRTGDVVEVRRRGIWSTVSCRATDTEGKTGPEERWEKNWPGLFVRAVPEGSTNWVGTYDWWRFRHHDRWWLDHPVCLLFRLSPAGLGENRRAGARCASCGGERRPALDLGQRVERLLRRLGLHSSIAAWVRLVGRASTGGLALGAGEPPDAARPNVVTVGQKRRLSPACLPAAILRAAVSTDSGGLQSSLHVRVYAPPGGSFHDAELGAWLVGSCHLDVNELMAVRAGRLRWGAGLPRGAPDPGLGCDLLKYGGNSEWAAARVADLWQQAFGRAAVKRAAIPFGEPQDWFEVQRSGTWRGRSWIMGKWWRSDGRLTVLDLPSD